MRRRNRFLCLLVLALGAGGITTALATGGSGHTIQPVAYAPTTAISVPPQSPAAALTAIVARLGAKNIVKEALGGAPSGVTNNGTWLHLTVAVPSLQDGLDVEPMWEGDLLEGAVAEASGTAANLHNDMAGSTLDAVLPNGTTIPDESGGMGDVVRGQVFSHASDNSVRASLQTALAALGLNPISIRILHPNSPAPAVVASTSDPDGIVKNLSNDLAAIFGNPATYPGYYFELRDDAGTPIVRTSASYETAAGRFWIDPKYRAESTVITLGHDPATPSP